MFYPVKISTKWLFILWNAKVGKLSLSSKEKTIISLISRERKEIPQCIRDPIRQRKWQRGRKAWTKERRDNKGTEREWLRKRLCAITLILLATIWQTVLYSPKNRLCWQRLHKFPYLFSVKDHEKSTIPAYPKTKPGVFPDHGAAIVLQVASHTHEHTQWTQ